MLCQKHNILSIGTLRKKHDYKPVQQLDTAAQLFDSETYNPLDVLSYGASVFMI